MSESASREREHKDWNPEREKPGPTRALQPSGGKALSHYEVDFRRWLSLNVRPTNSVRSHTNKEKPNRMFQNHDHADEIEHYNRVFDQLPTSKLRELRQRFAMYAGDTSTLPVHRLGRNFIDRIDAKLAMILATESHERKTLEESERHKEALSWSKKGFWATVILGIIALLVALFAMYPDWFDYFSHSNNGADSTTAPAASQQKHE